MGSLDHNFKEVEVELEGVPRVSFAIWSQSVDDPSQVGGECLYEDLGGLGGMLTELIPALPNANKAAPLWSEDASDQQA